MKLSDLYSQSGPPPDQAVERGTTGARDTSPKPAAGPVGNATAVSWIGVLLALILLRVVYEVSE